MNPTLTILTALCIIAAAAWVAYWWRKDTDGY